MQVKELFKMQRELDSRINKEHSVKECLLNKKIVAFIVEFSELANELNFFKYWSNKGPSPSNIILEEYVDGLHLILSLGLEIKAENHIKDNTEFNYSTLPDFTEEFIHINKLVVEFSIHGSFSNYYKLFNRYLSLGKVLGFDENQIFQGYILKNNINHKRQDQGY